MPPNRSRRRFVSVASAAIVASVAHSSIGNARSACRTADRRSAGIIERLITYVTATSGDDATSRDALRLPRATADDVQLVTSETVCAAAVAAYNRDRRDEGSGLSGRVYVVRIGPVYIVHDPEYDYNPSLPGGLVVIVFDSNWKPLAWY
jgi:hypothetical protein